MFKNDHLSTPQFDHVQFLLNAVAAAALDPQLAALLLLGVVRWRRQMHTT